MAAKANNRRQSRVSTNQQETIVEFLEQNRKFVTKKFSATFTSRDFDKMWDDLTQLLNCDGTGPTKPKDKWKKVLSDWKCNTKAKAALWKKEASKTGGGVNKTEPLTPLEERLLAAYGEELVSGVKHTVEFGLSTQSALNESSEGDEHVLEIETPRSEEIEITYPIKPTPQLKEANPQQNSFPTRVMTASSGCARPIMITLKTPMKLIGNVSHAAGSANKTAESVSQAPRFASQFPGFVSPTAGFTTQSPGFASPTPSFTIQSPGIASQAVGNANVARQLNFTFASPTPDTQNFNTQNATNRKGTFATISQQASTGNKYSSPIIPTTRCEFPQAASSTPLASIGNSPKSKTTKRIKTTVSSDMQHFNFDVEDEMHLDDSLTSSIDESSLKENENTPKGRKQASNSKTKGHLVNSSDTLIKIQDSQNIFLRDISLAIERQAIATEALVELKKERNEISREMVQTLQNIAEAISNKTF